MASENLIGVADSREARAFDDAARAWSGTGAHGALVRLVRSPYSGIPHDVGAAYATLGERTGALLDAIEHERLALPAADRDAVVYFAAWARRLRALEPGDARLDELIEERLRKEPPASAAAAAEPAAGIELAEAAGAERPSGIRARQSHFSASALNAYVECARKWYYRYACSAIEDRGSSAATYGTAFHLALEDFHGIYPRPRPEDESEMRAAIVNDVRWAFERNRDGFATKIEFDLQLRRAQRTAQRYVDWLLAQERRAPFTVIGREVSANIEIEGHAFVGFIDRLDRDDRDGSVGVVDYKTGSIATSAAEYREKVRTFRDFQLPFYYWARTEAGDRVSRLALIPLRDALLDVRPIVLEVTVGNGSEARKGAPTGTISVAELERARKRMIEICNRLASGALERFEVTTDPAACEYCAYALACADRPLPAAQRFGR